MPDYYHGPALLLTALLLPAFWHLYQKFKDTRTLLWFLGFLLAIIRMLAIYRMGSWNLSDGTHPWAMATGQVAIQISAALFLASLSPVHFRIGRFNILYVIPYVIPLVFYSILVEGVFRGQSPSGPLSLIFPALGLPVIVLACLWAASGKSRMPVWAGLSANIVFSVAALWTWYFHGAAAALTFTECASHFVTAMLVVFFFRRFTAGVVLGTMGFCGWSLWIFEFLGPVANYPELTLFLARIVVFSKVVAAVGMILLVLEDQVAANKAAQERERRARLELEAYANVVLSRRRVEDFDGQGQEICQTVVNNSRFAQAALLVLGNAGRYRLAGAAGLDDATASALDLFAERIPVEGFLAPGSAPPAVEHSPTLQMNLEPWLRPGDDLKRLRFTAALAVPLAGRMNSEGALLLAGMRRVEDEPLRADDLLPIEMLAARLQSARSQTMMLEKLIDSEKFAGLGQLAGNVTQQLNNPLTVILGYASLLEENTLLDAQERKGVDAILAEARRMRSTLESLTRIARSQGDQLAAVSVTELLADLEHLHRSEFLHRSIEFRVKIAPSLPRVLCHGQQLRQAVLHCLQFAIESVERQNPGSGEPAGKTVRLEASAEGNRVQILVAHSGPGFLQPNRAFDPFVPSQSQSETAGLGLSLCATILRESNGSASAINLEPQGAAIILELQAA